MPSAILPTPSDRQVRPRGQCAPRKACAVCITQRQGASRATRLVGGVGSRATEVSLGDPVSIEAVYPSASASLAVSQRMSFDDVSDMSSPRDQGVLTGMMRLG